VLLLFPSKIPEMGVESSISSKFLLRLVISILTIICLEDWLASVSLKYDCEPAKCGPVKDFPFQNDTKPCCPDETLLLEPFWEDPGDYDHQWEDPGDYDHQSHSLISEFEKTGNACLTPHKHFPRFPSASDPDEHSYLAFIRDCSSNPNVTFPYPHSTCPSPGTNRSYVALMDRPEHPRLTLSACESHVIVPVKRARNDGEEKENDDPERKWKRGFRLKWNLTSWENCVNGKTSGGKRGGCDGRCRRFSSDGKKHAHTRKKGITFRLILRNSNILNSLMRSSVYFPAVLSKLDKDFKGRGRELFGFLGFLFSFPFSPPRLHSPSHYFFLFFIYISFGHSFVDLGCVCFGVYDKER